MSSSPCETLGFGAVAVSDRLDQQVSQGALLEGVSVAEDVEQASVVGDRHLVDLREQPSEDVAFAGVFRDHVPEVADLSLTDAVDTPEALLDTVRVPGQVVVHHQVRTLKIESLARRIGGEHDDGIRIMCELLACYLAILAPGPAMDRDHCIGTPEKRGNLRLEVVECVSMLREDDDLPRFARACVRE